MAKKQEPVTFHVVMPDEPEASFADAEADTVVEVPHPSVKPPALFHCDATGGARFRVKSESAAATLATLHQLLDDSFHAVDIGLLPEGCKLTIEMVP